MVGRERDPDVGQADLMSEEVDEVGEFAIEIESHLLHLGRIGTDLVAEDVVRRQADGEKIGCGTVAEFLVNHQFLGERELVLVGEARGADRLRRSRHQSRLSLCDARWSGELRPERLSIRDPNILQGGSC